MLEIVSIGFILSAGIYYWLTKDFFHPSVIVSGLWAVLLLLYMYAEHPLWDLSNKFCCAISLWVLPFTLFAFICSKIPLKPLHSSYVTLNVNVRMFERLYLFVVFCNILFLFLIVHYAGGLSFPSIRKFLTMQQFPTLLNMLFYLNTFFIVYVFYALLNIDFLNKRKVAILFFLLLVTSMFQSNKTVFVMLCVSILYILKIKNKLKRIYILYAVIILAGLLTLVTLNRADFDFGSYGVINYIFIYILSPLTAFDALLNNEVVLESGAWGSGTFPLLYKILNNVFSTQFDLAELGTWTYVPLPTNVFTTMRGFYLDGGYMGIFLMACLLGIIWGVLYTFQASGHKIFTLFYALMIGSLFFQSFGDYFFYSFSTTLQYYIFSILISRGIVFHRKHH